MGYINQDPDIIVPFKGKQVVSTTKQAWVVTQAREEGLSSAETLCWCGSNPGSCNDCADCDTVSIIAAQASGAKLNISSGEDADLFR